LRFFQSNGHTNGAGGDSDLDGSFRDHPLAQHSKLTTSLTAAGTDDEDMIDITPRSSPGDVIGGGGGGGSSSGYHRETATESDTERDFGHLGGGGGGGGGGGNHHNQRTMHQLHHQHVPTHSAFGDPMDGEFREKDPLRKASTVTVCGVNQDHDHMSKATSPRLVAGSQLPVPSFRWRGTQLYSLSGQFN